VQFAAHSEPRAARARCPTESRNLGRIGAGPLRGDRGLGGANRNRTDDLLNAIQALSQLSYGPALGGRHIDVPRPHDQAPSTSDLPQPRAWLNPEP
jgi:hypothetical protein